MDNIEKIQIALKLSSKNKKLEVSSFLNKWGVYLEAGYGILSTIFRFFVQMTWKINIVEGLDAS